MFNPLSLLSLIPGNIWIIGLVAGAGFLVVTNYFNSIERQRNDERAAFMQVIESKDATIKVQQEQIAGYIIDKSHLMLSNNSLEGEIDTLQMSMDIVIRETQAIIESDNSYNEKIAALEQVIADQVRQDRIAAIRTGRRAELLLNYINSNVECWIANFDKKDGQCVQGEWRE